MKLIREPSPKPPDSHAKKADEWEDISLEEIQQLLIDRRRKLKSGAETSPP